MEIKVKRKYLGKRLDGGGVTFILSDNMSQYEMEMCYNRHGKEYFTTVKKAESKDNDKDNESPSE